MKSSEDWSKPEDSQKFICGWLRKTQYLNNKIEKET